MARLRSASRRLFRRGRTSGLRTTKTTVAAVLAFVLAQLLDTSPDPLLAPLTALLVVQLTMYETVAHSLDRIVSVVAGVLVAVAVATQVGLTWWSLGLVVAVSLIVGRLLRLGPNLIEVPISAMLVLALGGVEDAAAGRVYETLIGAAVGVVVTLVIAPPLYLQPAGDASAELAEQLARFTRELAAALRRGWSRAEAQRWLTEARTLGREVARADELLARAEQSARLNPRARPARAAQPRLRALVTGLELSAVQVRNLCRTLLDRTFFVPLLEQGSAYDQPTRDAVADALDAVADALDALQPLAAGVAADVDGEQVQRDVRQRIEELTKRRDVLATLLLVDPEVDEAAWEQHGALLTTIDRLRVEIAAAAAPRTEQWHPPPITARPRQAMRRLITPSRR